MSVFPEFRGLGRGGVSVELNVLVNDFVIYIHNACRHHGSRLPDAHPQVCYLQHHSPLLVRKQLHLTCWPLAVILIYRGFTGGQIFIVLKNSICSFRVGIRKELLSLRVTRLQPIKTGIVQFVGKPSVIEHVSNLVSLPG